jgi:hypothetical protein
VDESQKIRVSVEEASQLLGIEQGSVKKRIQRGKLSSEKDASGAIWVYLDKSETVQDQSQGRSETDRDELVGELRDRVRSLERRLDEEMESRRRADTIIAQLSQANVEQARTIRALEAPKPESPREWAVDEEVAREDEGIEGRSGVSDEQKHYERYVQPYEDTETPETVEGSEAAPDGAETRPDAPGTQEGVEHQPSNLRDWSGDVEARRRPWWRRIIGG